MIIILMQVSGINSEKSGKNWVSDIPCTAYIILNNKIF